MPPTAGKYGEDLSGGFFESGGSSLKLGSVRCACWATCICT